MLFQPKRKKEMAVVFYSWLIGWLMAPGLDSET